MGFIFNNPIYSAARESRLRNLFLHIDVRALAGLRVLELGCGTGEFGQAFVDAGCKVVSVDARSQYIQELKNRYPDREALVIDLETWQSVTLGRFDVLFCFGVLYHLSNPARFLAECAGIAPAIYLETVVCDLLEPACLPVDEEGPDQAFSGRGCRPSPSWLMSTMEALGFSVQDISGRAANWEGPPHSVFDWTSLNDGQWLRDGAYLRKMLIFSRMR